MIFEIYFSLGPFFKILHSSILILSFDLVDFLQGINVPQNSQFFVNIFKRAKFPRGNDLPQMSQFFSANIVKHHHICAHSLGHCSKLLPSFFSPRLSGQSPNSRKSAKLRKNFAGIFSKSGTTTAGASQQ